MLPPLWVCAVAALPAVGVGVALYRWVLSDELKRMERSGEPKLGHARTSATAAALVFTGAIVIAGWFVWLLSEVEARSIVFIVLWIILAAYFLIAAGTFRTQIGRFMPWQHSLGRALRETALHLVEALLWGPLAVVMLLSRPRE
jgi:hypothetical protein